MNYLLCGSRESRPIFVVSDDLGGVGSCRLFRQFVRLRLSLSLLLLTTLMVRGVIERFLMDRFVGLDDDVGRYHPCPKLNTVSL